MKIGNYEFGWIKPLRWHRYDKDDQRLGCGCIIWTFGFWYFTKLSPACMGDIPDVYVKAEGRPYTITLPPMAPGKTIRIYNKGQELIHVQQSPSEIIKLPPEKIKKARAALKNLDLSKTKKKRKKKRVKKGY